MTPELQAHVLATVATIMRASVHRFIGRLGGDPEVKFFQSGTCVATVSMAINRPGTKRDDGVPPDWFKVEVWGEAAQAFADTARKGSLLDVSGRVKTSRWTTRNGEERTDLVITADRWEIVPTPGQGQPTQQAPAPAYGQSPAVPAPGQAHAAYQAAGFTPPAPQPAPYSHGPTADEIPF
jgi:single-strand DNA-binding protein